MTFGERIKTIRNERGLSQRALGKMIFKAHTGVSKIELGRQDATLKDIVNICNALEITVLDLFDVPTSALVIELDKRKKGE